MAYQLPRPLSHSSLSMYTECPQKYKFKYVDGIPEKPRHFFSFGQSVHSALEFFYGVKAPPPPSLEELIAYYREHWVSAGYKDPSQEAQYFEDGRAILTQFREKHLRDFHIPFFVEYNFNLTVEGVPVTGKVDRIDKMEDGRIAILDYKTGKALAGDRAATDGQLTMYQMACEALLGAEVARLTFYHLPTLREQVVERRSDGAVGALKGRIVAAAEAITGGVFEPKPEERKCYWCDYKPLCPVFSHQFGGAPAALPEAPSPDQELSALIDRYGELLGQAQSLGEQADELKQAILSALSRKGYVRAFGKRYEASRTLSERWEFADKKKVLEVIRQGGHYDRILAPSAPKVEQLMADPALDPDLKARLTELGVRTETADLKVKPL